MRNLVLFMHTTLDGFVGGPNGEMDWIDVNEELFDFAGNRTDEADTALYGRVTFDMMEGYWPTAAEQPGATGHDVKHAKWYNSVEKIVVSKSLLGKAFNNTRIISDNVAENIKQLKDKAGKDILMFGSPSVAHLLMQHNLISDYWLFINPALLGEGIPLFADIKQRVNLKLVQTHQFSSGVVCLNYKVAE
jgi:dihydrofolate reductase